MTPSLEIGNGNWAVKSDSLLGYKTIYGKYYPREIGVTRSTTATRINADGLVELVPYNLVKYSEQFDNAFWNWVANSTTTANAATAPNGTLTADLLTESVALGKHYKGTSFGIYIANSATTTSVYVKPNGRTKFSITFDNDSQLNAGFDLLNESIIYTQTKVISANVENVGNGWYRCSVTNTPIKSNPYVTFNILDNSGNNSYTGDGTSGIYIWGAQVVEGTEPLDYLPTTDRLDIARIDYSSGDAALLVEPQRTNLALYSQQFDNAAWFTGGGTVTPNFATSPSGLTDAELVNGNLYQNANLTIGATYTLSVWAKLYSINAPFYLFANYFSSYQQYILSFSEYQRVSFTFTATQSFNAFGFSGSDVLIYGAQLEAGAYATSYIPTTSASVTRNVDLTVEKNITSFGIGNSYTLLFDLTMATEDSNKILFTLKNSAGTNSMTFRNFNNNLRVYDNIGTTYPLASLPNESTKWAFRFDGVNYSLFRVSGGVAVKYTATLGTARDIGYLSEINSGQTKASIKYFSIYPSALSDTECEQFVMS